MPKTNRQAGKNIRKLASKRRFKAITSFISAGVTIFSLFGMIRIYEQFGKFLAPINPSPAQIASIQVPFPIYALFLLVALGLVVNGVYLWRRANHADQGAKGEEDAAKEIVHLKQEGWEIEYGMRLGNRLGDADIVCISPQNKAYVIDIKSHRGDVITDGKLLYRRLGKTTYPFEKNFLEQVMKQALQVKKQKGLNFVTPMVAFSEATVSIPSGRLQKVYVVEKTRLLPLLKSLG